MKLAIVFFAGVAIAFPTNDTVLDASCIINNYKQVSSVVSKCTKIQIKSFTVPAGKTLKLHFKSGSHVTINGTITFEYKEWTGFLVEVNGESVYVEGVDGAKFDGQGARWWTVKGEKAKPKFFRVNTTGGSIFKNVDLLNCPQQCFSISRNTIDTLLTGCDVDVSAGDELGRNTDGYDISGYGITIADATVHNQDDCVAINNGDDIRIFGLTCIGGHGLSLSVGNRRSAAQVSNVEISNCTVKKSLNGIHVKTHADAPGNGSIHNVVYSNILMSDITNYGINVQQDYGGTAGSPLNNCPIDGLTIKSISATMTGENSVPVYILCGERGCKNFNWSNIFIRGNSNSSFCNFYPNGFSC